MARQMKNAKRANRHNPRVDRDNVVPFDPMNDTGYNNHNRNPNGKGNKIASTRKKVVLVPRNISQETYLDLLEDEYKKIVVAVGTAGSGKSHLAVMYAVQQLEAKKIEKIFIARPLVEIDDEKVGFTPGSLLEKLLVHHGNSIDLLREIYDKLTLERMLMDETIELTHLAKLRGRTLKGNHGSDGGCIIILEEAQNTSISQMKMLTSRLGGENSRLFINGDINQTDRKIFDNGLKDFMDRAEKSESDMIGVCKFSRKDVVRSKIVSEVLKLYGEE